MTRREGMPRRNRTVDLMLGRSRYPEDKRPTRFVSELLHGNQYKFIGPARGLDRAVELATARGFWNPVLQERTERFVTSFGMLYGENYLQAAIKIKFNDPSDEAQEVLYDTTLQAYRRLGKRAGQFFLKSYPKMVELGQDPEQYLARVEIAKDAGGSLFAARFARHLPEVIEAGGNQDEYGTAALTVRHEGSYRLSSMFMSLAPEMATEGEGSMYDYAARVEDSINTVGPELTSWAMPAYVYLQHRTGRDSQQTQDDLASIRDEHGEKAALWYAAGLRRIGEALPATFPRIRHHYHNLFPNDVPPTPQTLDIYRKSFLEVFTHLGVTATSFYARTVEFTDPAAYKDSVIYVQRVLGKALFDKSLWAIIRSSNSIRSEDDAVSAWIIFNHLVGKYRRHSTENFLGILNYAIKAINSEGRGFGILPQPGTTSHGYRERYGADDEKPYAHTHEGETALYNRWCFHKSEPSIDTSR